MGKPQEKVIQTTTIRIPYNYTPRDYQLPFWQYMDQGGSTDRKRVVKSWHRRAGKDKTDWNFIIREAVKVPGNYYYCFPTYSQAKKAIWDNVGSDGMGFLDHIPRQLLLGKPNETEMKIDLKNKSAIQLLGTENIDRLRGTNPRGVVFSEFAYQNPMAWEVMSPILAENGGWAIFNSTPCGENHFKDLLDTAQRNPGWFGQVLTVEDTKAIPLSVIDEERLNGKSEEMIQQEYFCSFISSLVGAYYANQVTEAYNEERIGNVPYDPRYPVETHWDIGINDPTAIIFAQRIGGQLRLIDCYEHSSTSLREDIDYVKSLPYTYSKHYTPHDANAREKGTGKSLVSLGRDLGITFTDTPRLGVEQGIEAAKTYFKDVWIDSVKCGQLIQSLKSYRSKYDETNRVYQRTPIHDWSSHFADAFRYCIINYRSGPEREDGKIYRTKVSVDYFNT